MLVNDIVRLEEEAEAVLAQARAEAGRIGQSAREEVEAYRRAAAEEVKRRVDEFRVNAEQESARAMAGEQAALRSALDALDRIPGHAVKALAEGIVERFRAL